MAYTDDAVLAKLSALNETQESIVTVAQWVMFHRRHADRTGQLWLQRLRDSGSNKRLNLIYLANEVAQQSKARRKDDFLIAFSPVIAEATATAYKGANTEIQQKLKRVVEVWRQRAIFELPIQEAIEARIEGRSYSEYLLFGYKAYLETELDRNRSGGKRGAEGSTFTKSSGSVPMELATVSSNVQKLATLGLSTRTSTSAADQDYDKITDPNAVTPSAPVHAARLNGLLKTLANAEGAVKESLKTRRELIQGLEQILKSQMDRLAAEENELSRLTSRRTEIDAKKKDVEDTIMRGFAPNSNPSTPAADGTPAQSHSPTTPGQEPDRPEIEALTPPTQSPLTPNRDPEPQASFASAGMAVRPSQSLPQPQSTLPPPVMSAGSDLLASLSSGSYNQATGNSNGNSAKKRKLNTAADDFPDLGGDVMDDIDDDVAAMLRQ